MDDRLEAVQAYLCINDDDTPLTEIANYIETKIHGQTVTAYIKDNTSDTAQFVEKYATALRENNVTLIIQAKIREGSQVKDYITNTAEVTINNNGTTDITRETNEVLVYNISVDIIKVWEDDNNKGGNRPQSVTVRLLANGQDTGKTLTLSDANGWQGAFTGLLKFKDGAEIEYTVQENDVPSGYGVTITGDQESGFIITNVSVPLTIKKEDDNGNPLAGAEFKIYGLPTVTWEEIPTPGEPGGGEPDWHGK